MAQALKPELSRSTSTSSLYSLRSSLGDSLPPSPTDSLFSLPSSSAYSTPASSGQPTPCQSRKTSWAISPPAVVEQSEPSEPFAFLSLPSEIRTKIYHLALQGTSIHISSPTLHRRRGGPNRTKQIRRLPSVLIVNEQIRAESLPLLAEHATLAFSDFFNFSHLLGLIPDSFAGVARRISLRGDVIVTPELLHRFPNLQQVQYTQLGNCVFAPTRENGWNAYASEASNAELVESVKARSASLVLLKTVLELVNVQRQPCPVDASKSMSVVELIAVANVLSSRERVSLTINVNQRRVVSREVVAEGHFFD